MLAVDDRVDEAVHELFPGAEQGWLDKVDHFVVFLEVVLQRSSGQDDPKRNCALFYALPSHG